MCLLTNERYKTYLTGFSLGPLGHAPGGGTLGYHWGWGFKKKIQKFNQIWCMSYLHEWQVQRHNLFGPRPLGLFFVLVYVPSQQLWSWLDGQFT